MHRSFLEKHYAGASANIAQKPYGASLKEIYFFRGSPTASFFTFCFFCVCVCVCVCKLRPDLQKVLKR